MSGRRLGAQRLERIGGRLVSVPDIGPRPPALYGDPARSVHQVLGCRLPHDRPIQHRQAEPGDRCTCACHTPASGRSTDG